MDPCHGHAHRTAAAIPCAVVTVSDTRSPETDASGGIIRERLEAAGHSVAAYHVTPDDVESVRALVKELAARSDVHAILVNGGTGIAPRDGTFEAVADLLDRRLDGFGEIFRALSFEEIGAAAMLSRAVAGLIGDTPVFSMPGSPAAVRLAMERLIVPELAHVVGEARKGRA
ncbi:MAG: MogA/MoaB family molybdenum cofactor biosynthesis protein [Candidatus Rokubacteria bacterium]|nr:MogA/MoaB family molybdenum cofactor biosynthesis protein [Candidatus Rokubacteria bacterium]